MLTRKRSRVRMKKRRWGRSTLGRAVGRKRRLRKKG